MPITLNAPVYKTVIRPVLRYGSETEMLGGKLARKNRNEDMEMDNWNKDIRPRASVANISEKIREAILTWLGHVERKSEEDVVMRT